MENQYKDHTPLFDTNTPPLTMVGGTTIFLVGILCGATTTPSSLFTPPYTPLTSHSALHPYSLVSVAPSLVSTHIYSFGITFSLRPDEVATVWWL